MNKLFFDEKFIKVNLQLFAPPKLAPDTGVNGEPADNIGVTDADVVMLDKVPEDALADALGSEPSGAEGTVNPESHQGEPLTEGNLERLDSAGHNPEDLDGDHNSIEIDLSETSSVAGGLPEGGASLDLGSNSKPQEPAKTQSVPEPQQEIPEPQIGYEPHRNGATKLIFAILGIVATVGATLFVLASPLGQLVKYIGKNLTEMLNAEGLKYMWDDLKADPGGIWTKAGWPILKKTGPLLAALFVSPGLVLVGVHMPLLLLTIIAMTVTYALEKTIKWAVRLYKREKGEGGIFSQKDIKDYDVYVKKQVEKAKKERFFDYDRGDSYWCIPNIKPHFARKDSNKFFVENYLRKYDLAVFEPNQDEYKDNQSLEFQLKYLLNHDMTEQAYRSSHKFGTVDGKLKLKWNGEEDGFGLKRSTVRNFATHNFRNMKEFFEARINELQHNSTQAPDNTIKQLKVLRAIAENMEVISMQKQLEVLENSEDIQKAIKRVGLNQISNEFDEVTKEIPRYSSISVGSSMGSKIPRITPKEQENSRNVTDPRNINKEPMDQVTMSFPVTLPKGEEKIMNIAL